MFRVSWQCFFLKLNWKSNNIKVFHDLQLSEIVLYACSTLCVVMSGLKTPRGRHSWAKNWFLEN